MANPAYQAARAVKSRARILDTSLSVFLARGYGAATLIELAEAARVSTATLFKHFPTKDKILAAAIERLATLKEEETQAAEQETPTLSTEGLRLIGLSYGRRLDHPLMLGMIRLGIQLTETHPHIGPLVMEAWRAPYTIRLETLLTKATERGDIVIPDIAIAARQFFGLITDQILWPRLLGLVAETPTPQRRLIVDEALRSFMARYGNLP